MSLPPQLLAVQVVVAKYWALFIAQLRLLSLHLTKMMTNMWSIISKNLSNIKLPNLPNLNLPSFNNIMSVLSVHLTNLKIALTNGYNQLSKIINSLLNELLNGEVTKKIVSMWNQIYKISSEVIGDMVKQGMKLLDIISVNVAAVWKDTVNQTVVIYGRIHSILSPHITKAYTTIDNATKPLQLQIQRSIIQPISAALTPYLTIMNSVCENSYSTYLMTPYNTYVVANLKVYSTKLSTTYTSHVPIEIQKYTSYITSPLSYIMNETILTPLPNYAIFCSYIYMMMKVTVITYIVLHIGQKLGLWKIKNVSNRVRSFLGLKSSSRDKSSRSNGRGSKSSSKKSKADTSLNGSSKQMKKTLASSPLRQSNVSNGSPMKKPISSNLVEPLSSSSQYQSGITSGISEVPLSAAQAERPGSDIVSESKSDSSPTSNNKKSASKERQENTKKNKKTPTDSNKDESSKNLKDKNAESPAVTATTTDVSPTVDNNDNQMQQASSSSQAPPSPPEPVQQEPEVTQQQQQPRKESLSRIPVENRLGKPENFHSVAPPGSGIYLVYEPNVNRGTLTMVYSARPIYGGGTFAYAECSKDVSTQIRNSTRKVLASRINKDMVSSSGNTIKQYNYKALAAAYCVFLREALLNQHSFRILLFEHSYPEYLSKIVWIKRKTRSFTGYDLFEIFPREAFYVDPREIKLISVVPIKSDRFVGTKSTVENFKSCVTESGGSFCDLKSFGFFNPKPKGESLTRIMGTFIAKQESQFEEK